MKKFRITYWLGSIRTSVIVKALNKQDALSKFHRRKGIKTVVSIEECVE